MNNGRFSGLGTRFNIGRTAHDDLSDGQASDQARYHIANALRFQFAVGWGESLLGVKFIGGLDREQGFHARYDGQRCSYCIDFRPGDRTKIRRFEKAQKIGQTHSYG